MAFDPNQPFAVESTPAPTESGGFDPSRPFTVEHAPDAHGSGIISNLGAGINRGIADVAGMPVDIANAGLNLFGLGSDRPIGGSKSIQQLFGIVGANPENVQAVSGGEQLARGIGQGVGSMVAPGLGAEAALGRAGADSLSPVARSLLEGLRGSGTAPASAGATAANVARNAAIGAASGVGQTAGEALAPPSMKPLAGTVGSMLGGLGAGAGEAAFRWAASRPSLETQAANRFVGSMTDPAAVRARLAEGEPLSPVSGSQPTTAEAMNDPGLLQTQNWARNQRPELFAQRAAENNAARVSAMAGIAPEGAAITPGQMVTDRLSQLDAAHQAVVDAATARAQETLGAVGGGQPAETVGANARNAIAANYAPAMEQANQAATTARQRLASLAQGIGGNLQAADADTVRQQYGDQLRQFVQEGRDARAQEENRLWNAARQNGDLLFDHTPTVTAAGKAQSMINAMGGDRLTPAEASLYDTVGQWAGPQDFDTIKAMRSNIGDAADMAFRSGDRRAGSRLLTVRNGLDQSIESAIDSRVAQERAAVQAGALDPSQTFEAALLRDRAQWQSARLAGERPGAGVAGAGPDTAAAQPLGAGAVPGGSGTASATPERRGAIAGDQGVAAAPAAGSTVDRYAAARAFTRETHQIFDQTPAGAVVARGPYGAPEKLPASQVSGKFANTSVQQVENARNFETAVGGRQEAVSALQDYLAFDLKNAAFNAEAGTLNPAAYQRWMKAHDGLMTIYPELRAGFENMAQAQSRYAAVQQLRDALTAKLSEALGDSTATVMGQYFKRGPAGADGIDRYLRETGGSPQAMQAMADHITNDFLARATRDGQLDLGRFAAWRATNGPALSRMPELAGRFADAGAAQASLADALANKTAKVREFEQSAARFWLRTDPNTAVTNALSKRAGNDPAGNMRALVEMAGKDPAAQAGIKRSVLDWIMDRGVSGKEAGRTGTDFIKTQTMQDLVNDNRPALKEVFAPTELKVLDDVAQDLRISDRSISGSKAPIGPGTARDVMARERYGAGAPTLLRMLTSSMGRAGAYLTGHMLFGPWGGIGGVVGADAAREMVSGARAARENSIRDLIVGSVLDPAQARALLAKASPDNVERLTKQMARRLTQSAVAGAAAYQGAPP